LKLSLPVSQCIENANGTLEKTRRRKRELRRNEYCIVIEICKYERFFGPLDKKIKLIK